ncbi:MAG TPA: PAS domain-containing protein, partial [Polyangiaceae bacterium]|nr:PAS domain-containing protein [Polyangiaceae bacterium]
MKPPSLSATVALPPSAFRTIVDSGPVAVLVWDRAGRILGTNTETRRLLGYDEGELEGRQVGALVPAEYEATVEEFLAALWTEPKPLPASDAPEIRMVRKDGSDVWVQLGLQRVRTDDGDYAVGAMISVDARRRAELAQRESEQRFATAFRVSPDVMSISDIETGRYIEVNEAHERAFGYTRAESIGKSPLELGIIASNTVPNEMVELLERDGHIRNLRVEGHTRGGETRIMLLSAEVIDIAGRRCVVRSTHDVTD